MKYLIKLLLITFLSVSLQAEDGEEELFSVEEETFYANELSEILAQIKIEPININSASKQELLKLLWLSDEEIEMIIIYRKTQNIKNDSDLIKMGLNTITIDELKEYIIFRERPTPFFKQIARVEFNEAKADYRSCIKYYQKTLAEYGSFKAGIVSQKDEGESNPIDFYSYFLHYSSESMVRNILLGKYRLALGQGILFAPKLGMSKSAAATSVPAKRYSAIKAYSSSYEIWELEGGTVELEVKGFSFIPFISQTNLNANLDSLGQITSFNESGLNLDESKKDNVQETLWGGAVEYQFSGQKIGGSISKLRFDHNFLDIQKSNKYTAVNTYLYLFPHTLPIFSEIAWADEKLAALAGIKFGDATFRQLLLIRSYQKYFPTWHGNAFSAQSNFDNETGVYYGMTILPRKNMKVNCYFDLWSFPKTRYFEKMPTIGSEQFLQIETRLNSNTFRLTAQSKQKEKYINLDGAEIREFERLLLRLDWWQRLEKITMKTRAEFVQEYLPEDVVYGKGFLFYEQLKFKMDNLSLIAQITAFHTLCEPFKVKHYMYENNISGIMQNSVFSGDGMAAYFLVKYKLLNCLELQFKISDVWHEKNKQRLFLQFVSNW